MGITVELSDEERSIIQGWYDSASGESASGLELGLKKNWYEQYHQEFDRQCSEAKKILALMSKLGIEVSEASKFFIEEAGITIPSSFVPQSEAK